MDLLPCPNQIYRRNAVFGIWPFFGWPILLLDQSFVIRGEQDNLEKSDSTWSTPSTGNMDNINISQKKPRIRKQSLRLILLVVTRKKYTMNLFR